MDLQDEELHGDVEMEESVKCETSSGDQPECPFDDDIAKSFKLVRIFQENSEMINSVDLSHDGRFIVSSSADDRIVIYDCFTGTKKRLIHSKKYGVDLARFTVQSNMVIHASSKVDDNIRYLSLQDNKYIRYFTGHEAKVTSIRIIPGIEGFVSGSHDGAVKIWDTRLEEPIREISTSQCPVVCFDPEGVVLALGHCGSVDLYDIRDNASSSFANFKVDNVEMSDIVFSPDGQSIAVTSNDSSVSVIDAFDGKLKFTIAGFGKDNKAAHRLRYESSFSAGGEYLIRGDTRGIIPCFDAKTGRQITHYNSGFDHPVNCVRYHPQNLMFLSCSTHMNFWLPDMNVIEKKIKK
ncbi:hypothetical protein ACOME3_008005 [Neoechinorhynchus agilis]